VLSSCDSIGDVINGGLELGEKLDTNRPCQKRSATKRIILLRNPGYRQKPSDIGQFCGNLSRNLTRNPLTAITPGERSFNDALREKYLRSEK
jgi:hypothetical protein